MKTKLLACLLLGWLLTTGFGMAQDDSLPNRPGRRYALVIGVRDYSANQFDSLPFAERDATELAKVLEEGGYTVTLMTQTRAAEPGLGSFAPLQAFVEDQLDQLLGMELDENDTMLVAIAGHGVKLVAEVDGSEEPHYYFCPADAKQRLGDELLTRVDQLTDRHRLISISSIYDRLKTCEAGHKLLMADICRSVPGSRSSSATFPRLAPPEGGVAAFFSCSENEKAWESKRLEHGVCFHSVIEGLRGGADAGTRTRPADGVISLTELQAFVVPSVRDYMLTNAAEFQGARQKPELHGSILGEFRLLEIPQVLVSGSRAGELREFEGLPNFRMAWIPAGRFTMGSPASEEGRDSDEGQESVELTRGYWMGETEVTQAQWRAVMGSEPWQGQSYVREGDDYPATYVNWDDATEFCRRLTEQERRAERLGPEQSYRLPTEAEWEYACRAGTTTAYYFGNDASRVGDYAWIPGNASDVGEEYAHRVGQKLPNNWGLRDMHGNVWEWCADWYAEELEGGQDPVGPGSGSSRVVRSGSWLYNASYARCSNRASNPPDFRNYYYGFRVVAE